MAKLKEYITPIMQIPDKLMILLLYLARFNCNDGPRVANLQVIYFRLCFDE
jgi:hypothetical protein